jgi:signal transduction histidine kinase
MGSEVRGVRPSSLDAERLWRVIDVGHRVLAERDPEAVLARVLDTAREITGARYAALGVLDSTRRELERFVVRGIDLRTQRLIGDLPRGRGVLGALIADPAPLRLAHVGRHPLSYGFPAGHPPMRSFLGVPIVVRGEVWGNLYLTEKEQGEFDQADEDAVVVLARTAALAIEHARLHEAAKERSAALERALRGLEVSHAIAHAIGGETDIERVLELIVKRGRALVEARSVVIALREGEDLVVAASAGDADRVRGRRFRLEGSTEGEVLRSRDPERIADVRTRLRIAPRRLGARDARTAVIVPLCYRGEALGVLYAFDPHAETQFDDEDVEALRAFAASAATAVATAQHVARERLRQVLAAAEGERGRWARELHDETLQALCGLRVLLAQARRSADPGQWQRIGEQAVVELDREIAGLRELIATLRFDALAELGLDTAIRALAEQRTGAGLPVHCVLALPRAELDEELQTTVYRLVHEALDNVVENAGARSARVVIADDDGVLEVEIGDDGDAFDSPPEDRVAELVEMRERVQLAGGTLTVERGRHGTTVRARLPLTRATAGVHRDEISRPSRGAPRGRRR